jgi:hypothetical protein
MMQTGLVKALESKGRASKTNANATIRSQRAHHGRIRVLADR